jgi:hypothetical protein
VPGPRIPCLGWILLAGERIRLEGGGRPLAVPYLLQ